MNFKEELERKTKETQEIIERFLPTEEGFAKKLAEAINYSMKAGGKRIRPLIMGEAFRLLHGQGDVIQPFMAAMEMIHTHSLIHDDLPAIDNDDYRRGKKTAHVYYGEATAILAGDALLNFAYETMMKSFAMTKDPSTVIRALSIVSSKTGINGMLGGQSVDVENDTRPLTKELLDYIYLNKTAALVEASFMAGAALAGADGASLDRMEEIGRKIGLAFQIQDDILDIEANEDELGKPTNSDEKNHKTTYTTLMGVEKARQSVWTLTAQAVEQLQEVTGDKGFLTELLESLGSRRK